MPYPLMKRRAYDALAISKKKRAGRTKARRMMQRRGLVSKGDGRDVHHRDGNPRNSSYGNLAVQTKKRNRADNK